MVNPAVCGSEPHLNESERSHADYYSASNSCESSASHNKAACADMHYTCFLIALLCLALHCMALLCFVLHQAVLHSCGKRCIE